MRIRKLSALGAAVAAASAPSPAGAQWRDVRKLIPLDGERGDDFGYRVAMFETTAIVSARLDDDNEEDSGSAYLFEVTTGEQIAKLLAEDGGYSDELGWGVGLSDQYAVVGVPHDDDLGNDRGAVYVFDAGTGAQINKLYAPDGHRIDFFGQSIGLCGNLAIVGARGFLGGNGDGAAYLLDVSTGAKLFRFRPLGDGDAAQFGWAVATDCITIVVGAPSDNIAGPSSGSAYLFDVATGALISKFGSDDLEERDRFGHSVAIDGPLTIVGALADGDNGPSSGSAYVFESRTGRQVAKLLPHDGHEYDNFGFSVAIHGETAIVGARDKGDNGTESGAAYVFDARTGAEVAKLLPADIGPSARFGESVAIWGSTAVVGAWGDIVNGDDSGSAYVCRACPVDINGDDAADTRDVLHFLDLWASGDPEADWNRDGGVDGADFVLYLSEWRLGCA